MNVSRETSERLSTYAAQIRKWNPRINLVAKSTLDDLEERHLADSLQILDHAPENWRSWVDLGSGGGFPGLVVAIAVADQPERRVTLVESDVRKAAFLRSAARECGVQVTVLDARIEALPPQNADVISARALAPLPKLLALAVPHLAPGGVCLFPKGRNWQNEVENARETWSFDLLSQPSKTGEDSVILVMRNIERV